MLVVVDTSTLISAVLWTGLPHRLIELAEARKIELCATEETLREFREVLARPKFAGKIRERSTTVEEIMQSILRLVTLYPALSSSGIVQADPDDDIFVACALAADAKYLINGDGHLLDLKTCASVSIVTTREFLERLFSSTILQDSLALPGGKFRRGDVIVADVDAARGKIVFAKEAVAEVV